MQYLYKDTILKRKEGREDKKQMGDMRYVTLFGKQHFFIKWQKFSLNKSYEIEIFCVHKTKAQRRYTRVQEDIEKLQKEI